MKKDIKHGWDRNRCLLLIMEKDLEFRFPYIEKIFCDAKYVLNAKNIKKNNYISTIVAVFGLKNELFKEYSLLKNQLPKFKLLFISNTEGFISKNIIEWIKKDFPCLKLITMQHGGVIIKKKKIERMIIKMFNFFSSLIFDYIIAGDGFINSKVDYYIVYNNYYKSELLQNGIDKSKIIVSTKFLKGEEFFCAKNIFSNSRKNNALFLLQCLSALKITDIKTEKWLNDWIINYLSKEYKEVFIKQHPYDDIQIEKLPNNCTMVNNEIMEVSKECKFAVSFFSVGLLECEYLGLETLAIYSKKIQTPINSYDLFQTVKELRSNGELVPFIKKRPFENYYESNVQSIQGLQKFINERL